MLERKLYQEIPGGKNRFHSAVLTSFSFNFHHFEHQVLRTLKQKWITSINVLVDQRMLDDVLGVSSGNLMSVSQSYSVNGITSKGAFHPKINFFIGDDELLVLFGSGNVTPGGHGKNHELFSGFYATSENQIQLPLILETWQYLMSFTKQMDGYGSDRIRSVLPSACSLLKGFSGSKHKFSKVEDDLEIALLYNDETNIFNQLTILLPPQNVEKITIVSPYYDSDGHLLVQLQKRFPKAEFQVFMQEHFGLPPTEIDKKHKIDFYNWNSTNRGRVELGGKIGYERKLHCKVFHFKVGKTEYCLMGSANATINGLGDASNNPLNQEFGALYKSNSINFLKELGVDGKKTKIEVQSLIRPSNISGDVPRSLTKTMHRIKSIDLNGLGLRMYLHKALNDKGLTLVTFNLNGEECSRFEIAEMDSISIVFRLTESQLKLNPRYCIILNTKNDVVSNKQLINNVDALSHTNPSESNRTIRQLIAIADGGQSNDFEIAEYLNEMHIVSGRNSSSRDADSSNREEDEPKTEEDPSRMTYDEAVKAIDKSRDPAKIINSNSGSRLWQSLAHLFETIPNTLGEELMDEEEEAESSNSRERKVEQTVERKIQFKSRSIAQDKIRSVERMAENYIQSIQSVRANAKHELDILDLHQFLLTTYLLTNIFCFTEYELPREISEREWKTELENKYPKLMLEILTQFALLCHRRSRKSYKVDSLNLGSKQEEALRKVIYYTLLTLHLIIRKCGNPVVEDKVNLIGLNILHSCGLPDIGFEEYIKNISKRYQDLQFSPNLVFRLRDELIRLTQQESSLFVYAELHGYCKIVERKSNSIRLKSLYGGLVFPSEKELEKFIKKKG